MEREQITVGNVVSCRPPDNRLFNTSWEHSAIAHCRVHREKLYQPEYTTYLTLGVTATRVVLKELIGIDYSGKLENWHGYVISKDGHNPPYVIPTFHPSYLLQGQARLTGVFLRDISELWR
jgi:uracil-DNA glycosylase family 4